MRGRRMRRAKHSDDKYGAATVVLLLLLAAAFVYAFQSLGIYDMLFKPVSGGTQSPGISPAVSTPAVNASPLASSTGVSGVKISEDIKMGSVTLYGVQLGVFTKLENAQATSEKFKTEGSAGYILKEDTLYRVVDSVYYSENDAKAVRDTYRTGASPDACVIRVQASGINWRVKDATREQIDSIKGAISVLQSQIVILINTQKAVQQNQGTADDWKVSTASAAQMFSNASIAMMQAVGSTNSDIILKLNDCLTQSSDSLSKLSKLDSTDVMAIKSGLKYDIIDMLLNLQNNIMG